MAYYTPPARAPATFGTSPAEEAPIANAALQEAKERGFELTPVVGYRLGGKGSTYATPIIQSVDIPASLSWGLTAELAISRKTSLEFLWSHQDTELKANWAQAPPDGTSDKLAHLNIDTFQIGALWHGAGPDAAIRPYLDFLLGVTILTPSPQYDAFTRFSGSIGGGAKFRISDGIGLKAGLRFMPIYVTSTNSGYVYCDAWYGCYTYWNSNYIFQTDAFLGLTFKF
jgi:hypothetical protein